MYTHPPRNSGTVAEESGTTTPSLAHTLNGEVDLELNFKDYPVVLFPHKSLISDLVTLIVL